MTREALGRLKAAYEAFAVDQDATVLLAAVKGDEAAGDAAESQPQPSAPTFTAGDLHFVC